MFFSQDVGIPGIAQLLIIIVSLLVCIGRLVESLIYRAMLPLGMASIYNGGLHSSGFRYIKKCIAIEIQGAIVFAVFVGSTFISNFDSLEILATFGVSALFDVAIGLAGMAVVVKSKSIANDIVGV